MWLVALSMAHMHEMLACRQHPGGASGTRSDHNTRTGPLEVVQELPLHHRWQAIPAAVAATTKRYSPLGLALGVSGGANWLVGGVAPCACAGGAGLGVAGSHGPEEAPAGLLMGVDWPPTVPAASKLIVVM
jgi:hypothetical protein